MDAEYGTAPPTTKGRRLFMAGSLAAATLAASLAFTRSRSLADTERSIRIMALGDSLTAGYGLPHAQGFVARLQAALDRRDARATVLDAGVSGDTSADGLARLDWALGDRPDAAIVELGANDGLRGLPTEAMQRNLSAILDRLQQRRIPTLLAGMYAPPNLGQSYFNAFHAVFDRLSRRPGLLFYPFFLDGVVGDRALNQADGIHPAAAGVEVIVGRMLPSVLQLIAVARAQQPEPQR